MTDTDDLVKLHALRSLLSDDCDPDLARETKQAIEFYLTGSVDTAAPLESFMEIACILVKEVFSKTQSCGCCHINLETQTYNPLWLRSEIVTALKRLAGYKNSVLVISGLRAAICPRGKYWTSNLQQRYASAIHFADHLAAHWATPGSQLNLVYI